MPSASAPGIDRPVRSRPSRRPRLVRAGRRTAPGSKVVSVIPSGSSTVSRSSVLERPVQRAFHGLRQQVEGERCVAEPAPGQPTAWPAAIVRRISSGRSPPSRSSCSRSMSAMPVVWVSTCHAVNGARPAASSSGSQRDERRRQREAPVLDEPHDRRCDDRLGDRRQQADGVGADPRSLDRRERVQAGDPLGAGDGEDHERDGAGLDLAGGDGEGGLEERAQTSPERYARRRNRPGRSTRPDAMPRSACSFATRLALLVVAAIALGACGLLPPGARARGAQPGPRDATRPAAESARRARAASGRRSAVTARSSAATACRRPWTPRPSPHLAEQVEGADWDAILAKPFEGECPRNFDGQEETYTFNVVPEPVVVASCTTAIDRPQQDPFRIRRRASCSASTEQVDDRRRSERAGTGVERSRVAPEIGYRAGTGFVVAR